MAKRLLGRVTLIVALALATTAVILGAVRGSGATVRIAEAGNQPATAVLVNPPPLRVAVRLRVAEPTPRPQTDAAGALGSGAATALGAQQPSQAPPFLRGSSQPPNGSINTGLPTGANGLGGPLNSLLALLLTLGFQGASASNLVGPPGGLPPVPPIPLPTP